MNYKLLIRESMMNNKPLNKQSAVALKSLNLEKSTKKIRKISRRTAEGIIEIGRELKWVKSNLEHGMWELWVREELGFHPTTAWRFMHAVDVWENLALTQDFNERVILRQLWGNSSKDPDIKSQQDIFKWLDKEIGRVNKEVNRLVKRLTFFDYYTPEIIDKLDNLAQVLVDVVQSVRSQRNK